MNADVFFNSPKILSRTLLFMGALCLSHPVLAAVTTLGDEPPAVTSLAKPNIMFTLDDSGSMGWPFIPDAAFILDKNGNSVFTNPNGFTGVSNAADPNLGTRRCVANHITNPLYYNPNYTYNAPVKADGTFYPDADYNWPTVKVDGFGAESATASAGSTTVTLSTGFRQNWGFVNSGTGYYLVRGAAQAPYYYEYTGSSPSTAVNGICYGDSSYTKRVVDLTDLTQRKNFANWFSYYRTREQAMKSAAGLAFSYIDGNKYRVGFNRINNQPTLTMNDFVNTARSNWYNAFYATISSGSTDSRAALDRVGKFYKTIGSGAPIQYSCQKNYHILSTDGYWNGSGATAPANGNNDSKVPSLPATVAGLTPGQDWPLPYKEKIPAAGTMSDVAAYYWATDLQAGMANNVFPDPDDPATWQHVVMFGISMGAKGTLPYDQATLGQDTIDQITAGTLYWPNPTPSASTGIDDLWHATVISRGAYFNVNDSETLSIALIDALNRIGSRQATAAGSGLASPDLNAGNNVAYTPSYKSVEWSGNIRAKELDLTSGIETGVVFWSFASKLDAQAASTGWDTGRRIVTTNNGVGVPFRWANLSTAQKSSLSVVSAEQQAVFEYLRGNRYHEGKTNSGSYDFRVRNTLLGDIVDSQPAVVFAPDEVYADAFNPGYSAFKAAQAGRTKMLYVGANDGMLHAVNAEKTGTDAGKEVWAYVPSFLFRGDATGLGALSYNPLDPVPYQFSHKFYVDSTPSIHDVDFSRTSPNSSTPLVNSNSIANPDWHTILISGMGKGGKGYFALDITTPPPSGMSETNIASTRVLWEFPSASVSAPDMGYTYGRPLIVKTARYGWVAVLPAGYNNVGSGSSNEGKGLLFVVDVKTGHLLHTFNTGQGSAGTPAGLAHINALIQNVTDETVKHVYGGDMLGNMWRFDLSTTTAWPTNATLLAQLRNPSSQPQQVTTFPRLAIDPFTARRYVMVGTGRLLDSTDLANITSIETFYMIRDGTLSTPLTSGLPITRGDMSSVSPNTTSGVSGTAGSGGWYMDLAPGEKVIKPALPLSDFVAWITYKPGGQVCDEGESNLYIRGFGIADSRLVDANGNLSAYKTTTGANAFVALSKRKTSSGGAGGGSGGGGKLKLCGTTVSGNSDCVEPKMTTTINKAAHNFREIVD